MEGALYLREEESEKDAKDRSRDSWLVFANEKLNTGGEYIR